MIDLLIKEKNKFLLKKTFRNYSEIDFDYIESLNKYSDILVKNPNISINNNEIIDLAYDVIHCGLNFISKTKYLNNLSSFVFHWPFLNPNPKIDNSSFKATFNFCFIKKGIISKAGSFSRKFKNKNIALSELVYRIILNGGKVRCKSLDLEIKKTDTSYLYDEIQFACFHVGYKSILILILNFLITLNLLSFFKSLFYLPFISKRKLTSSKNRIKYICKNKIKEVDRNYSAILPTINRYEIIETAIDSLLDSTIPPKEIIVVDQTPKNERNYEIYNKYNSDILKVFFLEKAGQCSSRNFALKKAKFDSVLLYEDDVFIYKDTVEKHIHLLEYSPADVSTGVIMAPNKKIEDISENFKYNFMTSVFATGGSFTSKKFLKSVNYLNLAYDKGMGADDDLGRRLYLNGYEIAQNNQAIYIHYKSKKGGMRQHGGFWRDHFDLSKPYPNVTVMYTILKYYEKKYWFRLILVHIYKVKKRNGLFKFLILLITSPFKVYQSYKSAKILIK